MEMVVRLESSPQGYTGVQIAQMVGMTPAGLAILKMDPEYAAVRARMLSKAITELDLAFSQDIRSQRDKLRMMVPVALDNLLSALDSKDERIKMEATKQVLNRDGRMAEVSRIGLPTDEQGVGAVTQVDNEIADALANALQGVRKPSIQDPVDPNVKVN